MHARSRTGVNERCCGLQEHPNIIRCYRCWQDTDSHCINLITEYFTSGNLREYRQKHRHLDTKAVKKWARQVRDVAARICGRNWPSCILDREHVLRWILAPALRRVCMTIPA